jgi:ATP/maltotriose-dependent transcriptional regulator MalT
LFFAGQLDDAETLLRMLAQRAATAGERRIELRARIYRAVTMYYLDPLGRLDELRMRAEEGLAPFERAHDDAGLFASLLALGHVHHAGGRHEPKRALSERALACARRLGNETRVKIITRYLIDSRVAGPTPVAETLLWLDEMEREGMEHPGFVVARARGLAMLGQFDEARHILGLSRAELTARGAGVQLAEAVLSQSIIELLSGEISAAETFARESWQLWEQMHNRTWLATAAAQLARALYAVGRLDEAESASETVRELTVSDDVEMQSFWRHLQAKIGARRGDYALAKRLAAEAVALLEPTDALPAKAEASLDQAETTHLCGRDARPELEQALGFFERKGNVVMVDRLATQLERYPDVVFAPVAKVRSAGLVAERSGRPETLPAWSDQSRSPVT